MSTVTEIKEAVSKLPPRKRRALVRWLQTQAEDRLSDRAMMAITTRGSISVKAHNPDLRPILITRSPTALRLDLGSGK